MKLKYYLRGLAVGILVTTVVLMIAGKGHKTTMTDDEVIARAKQLGMVMEDSKTGTRDDLFSGKDTTEDTESTQSTENSTQKTETKNDTSPDDAKKQENTGSTESGYPAEYKLYPAECAGQSGWGSFPGATVCGNNRIAGRILQGCQ